jgi:glycopeptide antibiotics resistance protein
MHINLGLFNIIIEQEIPDKLFPFVVLGGLFLFIILTFILRLAYINLRPVFCHKLPKLKHAYAAA